jgi:NTE family protein
MTGLDERTAVVLAGGGERVIAWQVGVLAGFEDSGFDLSRAAWVVGTSAGAHVAARLAGGEDMRAAADDLATRPVGPVAASPAPAFEQLARYYAEAGTAREGRRRVGALALSAGVERIDPLIAGLGSWHPPDEWPEALRVVAVDAERGDRRVLDSTSRVSPRVGVAASRAIPVLRRPVRLRTRQLIDGAIGSATNADVAIDETIDRVLIVAALPDDGDHPTLTELWNDALRRELAELDAAGIEVYIVLATAADLEAMGPDLMSGAQAALAVTAGRRAGRAVGPALATYVPDADRRLAAA